jgi:uncharacterized protein YqeY
MQLPGMTMLRPRRFAKLATDLTYRTDLIPLMVRSDRQPSHMSSDSTPPCRRLAVYDRVKPSSTTETISTGRAPFHQGIDMSIVARMRAKLTEAMKARDAVQMGFLRYWIAQLTLSTGAEVPDADAVKKMRGVLKEAKSGLTTWSAQELELIHEWVPPALTVEQIGEALAPVAEQIKSAPKDGMAMGIAMKALAGQQVESDDVKAVITALRA